MDPTQRSAGQASAARTFVAAHDDPATTNSLQATTFSALVAPAVPAPSPPAPTLVDTVLALPGTIISTALNLITQALAPLIGPGAPADSPALWAVLAFVRRQFNESFANSTPVLAPRQTSQDLDDDQVHGTFGATDADGDPLTYTVPATGLGAPMHGAVAIDQATGTWTYTPNAGYIGADSFYVTASDESTGPHVHALGQTHLATALVDVQVDAAAVNTAPAITAEPGDTDPVTGAIRYTVTTHDAAGDTVTVSVTTPPAHGTLAQDVSDPTIYVYKPDPVYAHSLALGGATAPGSDNITFTATDSKGLTGTVTVTPDIAPSNTAPTLTVLTEATDAPNGAVKVTITYADADGDTPLTGTISAPQHGYYAATIDGPAVPVAGTNPAEATTSGTTNSLYYVPDSARPGVETLTFSLTDAYGGTVTKTAQITVDATANHAPTITVTTEPTSATNGTLKVTITYADADSDTITLAVAKLEHGYYTNAIGGAPVPSDGQSRSVPAVPVGTTASAYYVPDPTRPGVENISFTVTDPSGASNTAATQFIVEATQNRPPTITLTPTNNADGTVTLEITIADADSDTVMFSVTDPQHGTYLQPGGQPLPAGFTVNVSATPGGVPGTLTYVPDPTRPGIETLSFTATDSQGGVTSATTTITVTGPAFPVAIVGTPDASTGQVTGSVRAPGSSGSAVTYSLSTPPSAVLGVVDLDPATGAFTFTPTLVALLAAYSTDAGTTPTAAFTVSANDGQGAIPIAVSVPIGVSTDSLTQMVARYGSTPSAVAVGLDGTIYVTNSGANTLSIIDPATNAITTTRVGRTPQAVAVGTDGRVWVVNSGDNTVSITNASGNTLRTVGVGQTPSAIVLDAYGTAYVTNAADDTVTVIDTGYGIVRTVSVGVTPTGIALGPDGNIYTANYGDGTVTIIDPDSGYTTDTVTLDGVNPYGIAVRSDGTVAVTDPLSDTVALLTPTGVPGAQAAIGRAGAATASTNGGPLLVSLGGSYVFSPSLRTVNFSPTAIGSGGDGIFYVANADGNTVITISGASNTFETIPVGNLPNDIAFGTNGVVYVTNGGSGTLSIINSQTNSTISIPVGVDPSIVTIGDNGGLLVVGIYDGSLSVISRIPSSLPDYNVTKFATSLGAASGLGGSYQAGNDGNLYRAYSTYGDIRIEAINSSGSYAWASIPGGFQRLSSDAVLGADQNGLMYMVHGGNLYSIDFSGQGQTTPNVVMATDATRGAVGSDGRVYLTRFDGTTGKSSVDVVDPNHTVVKTIDTSPAPNVGYIPRLSMDLVARGDRLYSLEIDTDSNFGNQSARLVIVNTTNSDVARVEVGQTVNGLAVGADGRIYLSDTTDSSVTVLSPNYSALKTIRYGLRPTDIGVGPNGDIFTVNNAPNGGDPSTSVVVINHDDYSLGAIDASYQGRSGYELRSGGGAVYISINAFEHGTQIAAPIPPPPPPPPLPSDPSQPFPQYEGPGSVAGLWNIVRGMPESENGVFTQTVKEEVSDGNGGYVVDPNGASRLIVYLGGTTSDIFFENQGLLENLPTSVGILKQDQIDAINQAVAACTGDCGHISEIMLVGYSQGGIDAQNLAFLSNPLMHWDNSLVTTVVTFGAPITRPSPSGVATIHLQDWFDPIPNTFNVRPLAEGADRSNERFYSLSGAPLPNFFKIPPNLLGMLFDYHGGTQVYQNLSQQFMNNSEGKYARVKGHIVRFIGKVIDDSRVTQISGGGGDNGSIA